MTQNNDQIYALSWKIFKLMRKRLRNDELNDLLNMTVSELLNEIEENPTLKDSFLWNDLFELFNAPINLEIRGDLSQVRNKNQLMKYVDKYILTQPENFDFYFKFGFKADFRTGYKLGDGTFYSLEKLPKHAKKFIKQHMPYEQERKNFTTITKKEWIRIRKRDSYMHISVKAIGPEKAKEKAFAKLRRNYNILKFVVGNNVRYLDRPETSFYYYMHSSARHHGLLSEGHEYKFNIWKTRYDDKYIKRINFIFNKQNPTELEQRILNAIDVYGLIEADTPLHVRFLLCIIGLESLLLGKDDRDYLGMKIAEKITFLLADVKWWQKAIYKIPFHKYDKITDEFVQKHLLDSRIKLHEKIRDFYNKRSSFAHSGLSRGRKIITEDDYHWSNNFLRWSIERILPMTKKFTHIAKKDVDDTKYLDSYFQNLRYAVRN